MRIIIAPSILSADFGNLNGEIKKIEKYCDQLHIDVMDGHFVPNITIGPCVVKSIQTRLPLEVHLMITNPVKYAPEFCKYAKKIAFHAELFENNLAQLKEAIKKIKSSA